MKKRRFALNLVLCGLVLLKTGACVSAFEVNGPYFFPSPPPNVSLSKLTGILESLGTGNEQGYLSVKTPDGVMHQFNLGAKLTIDSTNILCVGAPQSSSTPDPLTCPGWPAYVKLGKTTVTVYYWTTKNPNYGLPTNVAERLTTAGRARAR
jgi:hypothetical protein